MKHYFLPFIAVACLFFSSACSTTRAYTGPSRSASEVASLKGFGVWIHRVNGIDTGVDTDTVEVLPGKNDVEMTINNSNFNSRDPNEALYLLTFDAEAGKDYVITGRRGEAKLCAWVTNPTSGNPDFTQPKGCIARK